jgi:hypothetical protein
VRRSAQRERSGRLLGVLSLMKAYKQAAHTSHTKAWFTYLTPPHLLAAQCAPAAAFLGLAPGPLRRLGLRLPAPVPH